MLVGKDSAAAVWWTPAPFLHETKAAPDVSKKSKKSVWNQNVEEEKEPINLELTGWEVHRYRKDKSKPDGEWLYKGCDTYPVLAKTQVVIVNLTNDFEYRFEVRAINVKGKSVESLPSNPVMVEAPLPNGWHRFFDKNRHRYYYANVKIGKSVWTRPESDPNFLDESILFLFDGRELAHLRSLFAEDMHHYGFLGANQFVDILRECGEENARKKWLAKLIRVYTKGGDKVDSWSIFMEIMSHIKRGKMKTDAILTNTASFASVAISRLRLLNMLDSKRKKLGDW